jgi:hypothetical protein
MPQGALAQKIVAFRPRKVQLNLPQDASTEWIFVSHRFFLDEFVVLQVEINEIQWNH